MNELALLFAMGVLGISVTLQALEKYTHRLPMRIRIAMGDVDLEDPRGPDEIRAAYAHGRITESEMERRLLVALDEDRQTLRASVEAVSGIGPDTSWSVAERMHSEQQVAEADLDELEAIPNVGEKRAQMLKERLN